MKIQNPMSIYEKLNILSDAAKYDVACTSSGTKRKGDGSGMGNCTQCGICHSFSADGRCISMSKMHSFVNRIFKSEIHLQMADVFHF